MSELFECGNCGYQADHENLPEAQDLYDRVDVGGIFTDVECPECGALCFPVEPEPESNTINLELKDGTSARWNVPEEKVDELSNAIERVLGQPNTLLC